MCGVMVWVESLPFLEMQTACCGMQLWLPSSRANGFGGVDLSGSVQQFLKCDWFERVESKQIPSHGCMTMCDFCSAMHIPGSIPNHTSRVLVIGAPSEDLQPSCQPSLRAGVTLHQLATHHLSQYVCQKIGIIQNPIYNQNNSS